MNYTHITNPDDGETIDEVFVVAMKAPVRIQGRTLWRFTVTVETSW